MVVAYPEPSTSAAAKKKTRRKMAKKAAAAAPMDQDGASVPAPAPTADDGNDDDALMIDTEPTAAAAGPVFEPLPASAQRSALKAEIRRVPIPPHRMSPLQKDWVSIFGPLTELLGLQVRMNVPRKSVEIRVSPFPDAGERRLTSSRHQNTPRKSAHSRRGPTSSRPLLSVSTSTYGCSFWQLFES
jgi:RNA-binding protein PNO1